MKKRLPYGIGVLFKQLPNPKSPPKRFADSIESQHLRWIAFDISTSSSSQIHKHVGPILVRGIDVYFAISIDVDNVDTALRHINNISVGVEGGWIIISDLPNSKIAGVADKCRKLLSCKFPNNKSLGLITTSTLLDEVVIKKFDFISVEYKKVEDVKSNLFIVPNFTQIQNCVSIVEWMKQKESYNKCAVIISESCKNWAIHFQPIRNFNKVQYPKIDIGQI